MLLLAAVPASFGWGVSPIQVSTGTLYFGQCEASCAILSVPIAGGATSIIFATADTEIDFTLLPPVAYATLTHSGDVVEIPLTPRDGGVKTLATQQSLPKYPAFNSSTLFWVDLAASPTSPEPIMSMSLDGGPANVVAAQSAPIVSLAVEGTNLIYGWNQNADAGAVVTVPAGGGTAVVLSSGSKAPGALTVDSNFVYWADALENPNAAIMKAPIAGGEITTLVSGAGAVGALAVDSVNLYWASWGTNPGGDETSAGFIARVPLSGGEPTTLLAKLTEPSSLVLDGTSVYVVSVTSSDQTDFLVQRLTPK